MYLIAVHTCIVFTVCLVYSAKLSTKSDSEDSSKSSKSVKSSRPEPVKDQLSGHHHVEYDPDPVVIGDAEKKPEPTKAPTKPKVSG